MPEVSVLMPVRNGDAFLGEAIDSILAQSLRDFELIIVDDGSTDGSAGIVRRYAASDPRVRYLVAAGDGIAAALQSGLAAASGALIARMDADDVALPDRLAAQRDHLRDRPAVVAVGGQIEKMDRSGRSTGRGYYPRSPETCRSYLRRGSPFCHPAVTMRASALFRCGGYRQRYGAAEDYDLWLRLAGEGELDNLDRVVLRYRVHGRNVTLRNAAENARDTALAYIEAFHPSGAYAAASEDWATVEARLPAEIRLVGRTAYLRALALNGGIVAPLPRALLVGSLGLLRNEAERLHRRDDLAFMLLRAARQFFRVGEYGLSMRLASLAAAVSRREVGRTLRALVERRV